MHLKASSAIIFCVQHVLRYKERNTVARSTQTRQDIDLFSPDANSTNKVFSHGHAADSEMRDNHKKNAQWFILQFAQLHPCTCTYGAHPYTWICRQDTSTSTWNFQVLGGTACAQRVSNKYFPCLSWRWWVCWSLCHIFRGSGRGWTAQSVPWCVRLPPKDPWSSTMFALVFTPHCRACCLFPSLEIGTPRPRAGSSVYTYECRWCWGHCLRTRSRHHVSPAVARIFCGKTCPWQMLVLVLFTRITNLI